MMTSKHLSSYDGIQVMSLVFSEWEKDRLLFKIATNLF